MLDETKRSSPLKNSPLERRTSPFESLVRDVYDRFSARRWLDFDMLAAVSGGPDSVALVRVLNEIYRRQPGRGRLIVVHCNHQTRPSSWDDQLFVENLAKQLDLDVRVVSRDTLHADLGTRLSPEDSPFESEQRLRDFRYDAMLEIARTLGARYIATGHTRDDQIETLLFRIFRGTGFQGLAGIPSTRVLEDVTIVRPFLTVDRKTICEALQEIGQDFCIDPTNSASSFSRNFIRNQLLPLVRQRFPGVGSAIIRLGEQAGEIQDMLIEQAQPLWDAVTQHRDDAYKLDCQKLSDQHPPIIQCLLVGVWNRAGWPRQKMDGRHWHELTQMVLRKPDARPHLVTLPGPISAERSGNTLILKMMPDQTGARETADDVNEGGPP
jgi:tRNA(Ile)-lysidine synthase